MEKVKIDELVICDGVRTPFCHGVALRSYPPAALLAMVFKELTVRNHLDPFDIDGVIAGCIQQDTRSANIARIAAMEAGFPNKQNGFSIQCNCNSGFMGILAAIGSILSGCGTLYLVGGVESMSRFGYRLEQKGFVCENKSEMEELLIRDGGEFLKNYELTDCLVEGLTDRRNNISMIEVAEVMANCFGISREEQDEYAINSYRKALEAADSGVLASHILPVGDIKEDSYPRNRHRLVKRPEQLGRTAAVFGVENPELPAERFFEKHKKIFDSYGVREVTPTVTMYNSCIPGDGAGGIIVTTERRAQALGLKPRLKIINWAVAGVNPLIMGIGPLESTCRLFAEPKTKSSEGVVFEDIGLIEIHEAFASQVLSVFKEGKNRYGENWAAKQVNPYGGSLAFTHPLGATNMRLITDILTAVEEKSAPRFALACGCAGGGQGTSLLLECIL